MRQYPTLSRFPGSLENPLGTSFGNDISYLTTYGDVW
jgi:hypothetical protein